MRRLLAHEDFVKTTAVGNLGTHSFRKYASTHCRQQGISKDDVDYQFRWQDKRMQDQYTDTQLAWPDANAASKLSGGSVVIYKAKDGSGVTD